MQCVVVLQVSVTIKQIKLEHSQNCLFCQIRVRCNLPKYKRKLFENSKIWVGIAPKCPPWLRAFVPIFHWKDKVINIGSNYANVPG